MKKIDWASIDASLVPRLLAARDTLASSKGSDAPAPLMEAGWGTARAAGQGRYLYRLGRLIKVAFDLSAAACMLVVIAPVFGILAVLVAVDGGPVLYGHPRIGAGGRVFRCLKLRTMVTDGQAAFEQYLTSNPAAAAEWSATHKLRSDPRVTPIGRFLRKTSLDELPQLLNILRLEMSLVGPRPIVDAEVERYGDGIVDYYQVRPGLTGLWQVSGRSKTSYAFRVQLDRQYVRNRSFWLDLSIILRTIPAVLRRDGAF